MSFEVSRNILGVVMIVIGIGIMIIAVILIERREKSLTEELELKEKAEAEEDFQKLVEEVNKEHPIAEKPNEIPALKKVKDLK